MPTHLITAILLSLSLLGCASRPGVKLPTITPALNPAHAAEIEAFERADAEAMPEPGRELRIG